MYGNTTIIDDIKYHFRNGGMVTQLIFVNLAVYLFLTVSYVFMALFEQLGLYNQIVRYLEVPASVTNLLWQPWSLVTYMFTHTGIWHIAFNMLILYWMGVRLVDFVGNRRILPIYIYGGLFGAMLYILCFNLFPLFSTSVADSYMLGASAGVMAILVALATYSPDYSIRLLLLGMVKMKYIALFFVLTDFVYIVSANAGGHIAHLGGALFGYLYIKQLQAGTDWAKGFNRLVDSIVGSGDKSHQRRPVKETSTMGTYRPKVVYKREGNISHSMKKKKKKQPLDAKDKQARIDQILDKISASGYDSLSKEEKEFLFKASKED